MGTKLPVINMAATGNQIDMLRKNAGFSVKDLQDIFGFNTPNAIYKWIHGLSVPTVDNLVILASVLNVGMDKIIVCDLM